MAFHDLVFPVEISYGSKGGPQFRTTVITLASGMERRNVEWTRVRAEYDVSHGIKDKEQMEELRDFFFGRRGRAHSFRFLDWADYEIYNQVIGYGDGLTTDFQIIKSYEPGPYQYDRVITKPMPGTVLPIRVNDVPYQEGTGPAATRYTIDYATGKVKFAVAPAAGLSILLPYVKFHVHTRFDVDVFDPVHDFWNYQTWDSIPLVEIKDKE